jgi:outer membrane protein assembly factor BamB
MRWVPPLLALVAAVVAVTQYPNPALGLRIIIGLAGTALVWCAAAVLTHPLGWKVQRVAVVVALLVAVAMIYLVRIDGTTAELWPETRWRWSPTPDEIAATARDRKAAPVEAIAPVAPGDWPQFRGTAQESRLVGATVRTNWDKQPPKELWRKPIGPAWGSCIAVGDLLFTQEQRGPNEATICLKAESGDEVWADETPARFDEAISGVGPRGTPTYADGFVYAFGATGSLAKLDARTGKVAWKINAPAVAGSLPPNPFWGYASSPFIANGLVVVFLSGGPGKGTAAFKVADGSLAWVAGDGRHGYCAAHRTTLCGVDQLLMASDIGLEAHDPTTGRVLWSHLWPTRGNRSTQPILLGNDELLLPTGYGVGTQRLKVTKSGDRFGVSVVWESRKFKPYYNDAVFHNGLVFGFDDKAFVCLDPETGQHRWNAGAIFGFGQVLLLANSGMLVVQAESGKVALVEANGDDFVPVATLPAMARKSWNHPVIANGKLFVRNGSELVCFDVAK